MSQDSSITAAAKGSAASAGRPRPAAPAEPEDGIGVVVYRTPGGWRVGGDELPDLVNAMAFADLLSRGMAPSARPRGREPQSEQTRAQAEQNQSEQTQSDMAHVGSSWQ